MLRSFLVMTALITPTSYLWAEDIQLRCDPVSGSSDPLMVRVMPSAPEVFVKQGEVARTYIPRTYRKNDKDSPVMAGPSANIQRPTTPALTTTK